MFWISRNDLSKLQHEGLHFRFNLLRSQMKFDYILTTTRSHLCVELSPTAYKNSSIDLFWRLCPHTSKRKTMLSLSCNLASWSERAIDVEQRNDFPSHTVLGAGNNDVQDGIKYTDDGLLTSACQACRSDPSRPRILRANRSRQEKLGPWAADFHEH